VPFFAFRPEEAYDATPALVVDLSDGGVQILTAGTQALPQKSYGLELVTDEPVGQGNLYRVHAVWSRPDGVNTRTGFAFMDGTSAANEVQQLLSESERHVLRCVLYPSLTVN
jgi:hypothetical protein